MTAPDPELLNRLRLGLIPGLGPRHSADLLNRFGSATAVFAASGAELREVVGKKSLPDAILEARHSRAAEEEWQACQAVGVSLVGQPDELYPRALREIPDPPSLFYCRGDLQPRDNLAIALVGSRQCTLYGTQTAERLARGLALAGLTIVSGLARGIDAAAHRGALAAGGRTIAVCAPGLGTIYPPEHAGLADEVAASGALLSESPLDREPRPGLFPQRNRIISGMSVAVIIVEAGRRSGALHTARHAMEQGRDVFAVPGRIDSLASQGCHDLIRDGVTLIRGVDDILESLGPLMQPVAVQTGETVSSPRELLLNDIERVVLNRLTSEPEHVDALLPVDGLEPSQLLATLTVLEMKRLVRRLPGGYVCRAPY
ncbi:MAG: DNA-processing protein DprA [Planctomyces sp.]|nr:DNA-processing protein DprA [Planctomyces sp.]